MVKEAPTARTDESRLFAAQLLEAEQQKAALSTALLGSVSIAATIAFVVSADTLQAIGDQRGVRFWIPVITALGAAYEWCVYSSLRRGVLGGGRLPAVR